MTIYFPTINATIFHVPKTGGTTIRVIAEEFSIPHKVILSETQEETSEHIIGSQHTNRSVEGSQKIAIVRNPITWYKSYWAFRAATRKFNPDNKIDLLWHGRYPTFIEKVQEYFPDGYLSTVFDHLYFSKADIVLKFERLDKSLSELFGAYGISLEDIENFPRHNTSPLHVDLISEDEEAYANRIITKFEKGIIKEYYGH